MKELTPQHLRCGGSQSSCPGVHDMEDGTYKVVGRDPETGEERAVILEKEFFTALGGEPS
jgi:hypothetical protein